MVKSRRQVHRFHHPGAGRRRAVLFGKGRQLDPTAHDEVRATLGAAPRRHDLLIEHLHRLQDRFGCLDHAHLVALAEEMRLSLAEVYEVATFYAHFDVVREAGEKPPALTIRVCDSISCALAGADELLVALPDALPDARILRAPCMGRCDTAPVVEVGHRHLTTATVEATVSAARSGHTAPERPGFPGQRRLPAAGRLPCRRA